jgi:hypothetical protein
MSPVLVTASALPQRALGTESPPAPAWSVGPARDLRLGLARRPPHADRHRRSVAATARTQPPPTPPDSPCRTVRPAAAGEPRAGVQARVCPAAASLGELPQVGDEGHPPGGEPETVTQRPDNGRGGAELPAKDASETGGGPMPIPVLDISPTSPRRRSSTIFCPRELMSPDRRPIAVDAPPRSYLATRAAADSGVTADDQGVCDRGCPAVGTPGGPGGGRSSAPLRD